MAAMTVIAATTDAVSTKATFNAHGLVESLAAIAGGLAGSEKVFIWVGTDAGWVALYDNDSQVTLTATSPACSLLPGLHYGFTKEETAAPVSVEVNSTR